MSFILNLTVYYIGTVYIDPLHVMLVALRKLFSVHVCKASCVLIALPVSIFIIYLSVNLFILDVTFYIVHHGTIEQQ